MRIKFIFFVVVVESLSCQNEKENNRRNHKVNSASATPVKLEYKIISVVHMFWLKVAKQAALSAVMEISNVRRLISDG